MGIMYIPAKTHGYAIRRGAFQDGLVHKMDFFWVISDILFYLIFDRKNDSHTIYDYFKMTVTKKPLQKFSRSLAPAAARRVNTFHSLQNTPFFRKTVVL